MLSTVTLIKDCHRLLTVIPDTRHQRVRAQGWNVRMSHNDFIDQYGMSNISFTLLAASILPLWFCIRFGHSIYLRRQTRKLLRHVTLLKRQGSRGVHI